jgi:hypothetical protein
MLAAFAGMAALRLAALAGLTVPLALVTRALLTTALAAMLSTVAART